jgi:hypothetical protein
MGETKQEDDSSVFSFSHRVELFGALGEKVFGESEEPTEGLDRETSLRISHD